MKFGFATLLRFFLILLISIIAFRLFYDSSLGFVFLIGLLTTTIICILIGDGFILPNSSNFVASIIESILAFVLIYIIDLLSHNFNPQLFNYLIFMILILVFEYAYHGFLFSKEKILL